MKRLTTFLLAGLSIAAIAGCDGHSEPAAPVARPVLSILIEPASRQPSGFAGVIEPRYQTDRAFQVLGRIIGRPVDVGDMVAKGQVIAEIDPLTYQLDVRKREADLAGAKSQLEKAVALKGRVRTLVNRGVSAQADLDLAEASAASAAASVQVAAAELAKAREDLSYTKLTADMDGVVTRTYAEVGQMASSGAKVMTLARTDVREAVVDVPEELARSLPPGAPFEVRLQSDLSITTPGRVREIAPEADEATRLRRVKITLDRSADPFRLGATIMATLAETTAQASFIDVPAAAVFERDGEARVWIVDSATKRVRSVSVEVAANDGRTARIARGLAPGLRVVIAGANSLSESQAVQIQEGAAT